MLVCRFTWIISYFHVWSILCSGLIFKGSNRVVRSAAIEIAAVSDADDFFNNGKVCRFLTVNVKSIAVQVVKFVKLED